MRRFLATMGLLVGLAVFHHAAYGCCSLAPASFSSTKGFASEASKDGKLVHLLGYQNVAVNKSRAAGGNAMLLPIPAKFGSMSEKNILDTRHAAHLLTDMEIALNTPLPGTRSSNGIVTKSAGAGGAVIVFNSDIYTIVLASDATQIPGALKRVPSEKRPQLNKAIFDAYAKWYPGWTFALCCFNNKDAEGAKPMIWWYEPNDSKSLFFPALDEHGGTVPPLKGAVQVDHVVMFSVPQLTEEMGHRVLYSDPRSDELKSLLPKYVLGESYYGKMAQGDFRVDVSSLRQGACRIARVLPPGVSAKPIGWANDVYTPEERPAPDPPIAIGRAMGNIAPYRQDMLQRIAGHYKRPTEATTSSIVLITIAHNGSLLSREILESAGVKRDSEALKAIDATKFEPLPDWYLGDQLQFKIEMKKVASMNKTK